MIRRTALLVATAGALVGIASSLGASDTSAVVTVYEKYTLRNGLEVILSRDERLPLVAVNLWYHVGAVHERTGKTGFAHLFEHMMFQGSAHVASGQHLALLERAGATDLNATTDFDRTNYFQSVPANYLETVLWLESDRMGFLLDALTREKFNVQRDVVKNERRQRVENAPYGLAEEQAWQALFPLPHPYHGDVIGSTVDLDNATLDDVRQFFRRYYVPSNATLTVVGDFDPLWTRKLIEKYFGSLPSGSRAKPPVLPAVRVAHATTLRGVLRPGTLPLAWFGWHSPAALTPADAAADLLATILAEGESSRLHRRLIRELKLAQSVSARQQSLTQQSAFVVEAVARPGVAPEQLAAQIEAELARIRSEGVESAEVLRARNILKTRIITSLQSYAGLAERLQYYNQYASDPGYLPRDLARYDAVTAADIRRFATGVLAAGAQLTLLAQPKGS